MADQIDDLLPDMPTTPVDATASTLPPVRGVPFVTNPPDAPDAPDKPLTGGITPGLNRRSADRTAIALPPGAKSRLLDIAADQGCTLSDVIRAAIAKFLDWPEIAELKLPGRPPGRDSEKKKAERREKVPIPKCVNVPKRRRVRGL